MYLSDITEHIFFGLVLQQPSSGGECIFLEEEHRLEKWAPPGWKNGTSLPRSFGAEGKILNFFLIFNKFFRYSSTLPRLFSITSSCGWIVCAALAFSLLSKEAGICEDRDHCPSALPATASGYAQWSTAVPAKRKSRGNGCTLQFLI